MFPNMFNVIKKCSVYNVNWGKYTLCSLIPFYYTLRGFVFLCSLYLLLCQLGVEEMVTCVQRTEQGRRKCPSLSQGSPSGAIVKGPQFQAIQTTGLVLLPGALWREPWRMWWVHCGLHLLLPTRVSRAVGHHCCGPSWLCCHSCSGYGSHGTRKRRFLLVLLYQPWPGLPVFQLLSLPSHSFFSKRALGVPVATAIESSCLVRYLNPILFHTSNSVIQAPAYQLNSSDMLKSSEPKEKYWGLDLFPLRKLPVSLLSRLTYSPVTFGFSTRGWDGQPLSRKELSYDWHSCLWMMGASAYICETKSNGSSDYFQDIRASQHDLLDMDLEVAVNF